MPRDSDDDWMATFPNPLRSSTGRPPDVVVDGPAAGFGRRQALLLLAGSVVPAVARADEVTPVPQITTAPPPQPAPQVAQPAPARAAAAAGPIDKTKTYYVFFDQNIDLASMRALRRQLAVLVEAGVSEIDLVIDSAGGLIEQTMITYSFIRALPATINTHAQGFVQSAATVLFLAGQQRSADRNVRFLFHPSQLPVTGYLTDQQIRERLTGAETVTEVVAEIYRDRTKLSPEAIERFAREEVYVTAEQARGYGIVQTVADLRMPGEQKAKILFLD